MKIKCIKEHSMKQEAKKTAIILLKIKNRLAVGFSKKYCKVSFLIFSNSCSPRELIDC
jgi:hypothetical protein